MKLTKHSNLIFAMAIMATSTLDCFAGDSVSNDIKGKVVASPCTTINGGTATIPVSLGDDIQTSSLATPGSGSTLVKFEFPITDCPVSTSNVKATFSGTADSVDNTLWKNTATSAAPNTAVELSDQATGTKLSNGSVLNAAVTSGTATYKLQARAYSVQGSAKPGDIESIVVMSFEYQ
ncbi:TPA: type 1 fimbrial protein [Citrobacter farmeri]|nr:type 1 fimbrial protein [Citrobacter farmeri]HBZ9729934.1 type 1 fimbrial protein [Citrobacter farmeri]HCA0089593.1 type 1 fimbrial protein [Citrobacter farmeri]HCA0348344.1 type 1 fimbrial protein [Citrobacter farmeri]HCA0594230.1 type 1 fimbrial protein [Citrobacter farmeri]